MTLRAIGKVTHVMAVITGFHGHRSRCVRFSLLWERMRLMAQAALQHVGRIMWDIHVRVDRITVLTQRLNIPANQVFERPVADQAIHSSKR